MTMPKRKMPSVPNVDDLVKSKPSIMPMGFAVGDVEDALIVIDFIDVLSGKPSIIESIVMPRSKALQLSKALAKAVADDGEVE